MCVCERERAFAPSGSPARPQSQPRSAPGAGFEVLKLISILKLASIPKLTSVGSVVQICQLRGGPQFTKFLQFGETDYEVCGAGVEVCDSGCKVGGLRCRVSGFGLRGWGLRVKM